MRKGYLLTCNETSDRTQFSIRLLKQIGFEVHPFKAIPHTNKVISNKLSMMAIYDRIASDTDEWAYVFEDDINLLESIQIEEIVQYETISSYFFYLGLCKYGDPDTEKYPVQINHHDVTMVAGDVRGLHAIGISKIGARALLRWSKCLSEPYMDVILELFSRFHPANIVRYDLESYIKGHRGIFFQDRRAFPSTI